MGLLDSLSKSPALDVREVWHHVPFVTLRRIRHYLQSLQNNMEYVRCEVEAETSSP